MADLLERSALPAPPANRPHRSMLRRVGLSLRYLVTTESHAFAFSIAANALLSFFPFVLILLTLCRRVLHWNGAYLAILDLLRANLPTGADFVIRNLAALVGARRRVEIVSVLMLLFTSDGVFLPLEIALNRVWGVTKNRSFLRNAAISFALAFICGVLALLSISAAAGLQSAVQWLFGWMPATRAVAAIWRLVLEALMIPVTSAICFIIYFILPNGSVPARRVLPAAVLAGILIEVAKVVYTLTLPLLGLREIYGPFSLSVTLLFWAFLGSLILLWGANFSAQGPSLADEAAAGATRLVRLNLQSPNP